MAAHQTQPRLSDGDEEATPGSILLDKLVGGRSILTKFLMEALHDEPVHDLFSLASREEGSNALRKGPMQQPQMDESQATAQLGKSMLIQLVSGADTKQARPFHR